MPWEGVPFGLRYRSENEENAEMMDTKSKAKRGRQARVGVGALLPLPEFLSLHSEFP